MSGYIFRSDAIAASSPSGRMSKRASAAIDHRIADQLFGPHSGFAGWEHIPDLAEIKASRILQLRSYIATLKTACAGRFTTGRQNGTTRARASAEAELAALDGGTQ